MYQEYLNQLQISIAPLTSDELKDLLNNDGKLDEKVDEVLETLRIEKNTVYEQNRQRAEANIEKEPKIIELRSKLTELAEEGRTLCSTVQEKLTEIKEKSSGLSQEAALALLQTAASESEEQTEALVKKFTDNEIAIEEFLEKFLINRKAMHLRKLKAEKMQEIINNQRTGNIGVSARLSYGNLPGGSGFYPTLPQGNDGVPYPLGPMMPMPPMRPY